MYQVVCSGDKCHPPTCVYADRRAHADGAEIGRGLKERTGDEPLRLNHEETQRNSKKSMPRVMRAIWYGQGWPF